MRLPNTIICLVLLTLLVACGSTTSTSSGTALSDTQSSQTGALVSQLTSSIVATSAAVSADEKSVNKALISCPSSGTLDVELDSLVYDECVSTTGDLTITTDGSMGLEITSSTVTVTYDLSIAIEDSSTNTTETMSMVGTVSQSSDTSTADISGTIDDISYSIEGSLTVVSSIMDGELNMSIDDINITCTYTSFDTSTADEDAYADECVVS